MMKAAALGLIATVALAAPAGAMQESGLPPIPVPARGAGPAPLGPPLPGSPDWERLPTRGEAAMVYPAAAVDAGASGKTVIRCGIKAGGLLTNCNVLTQTPAGLGFGRAALMVTRYYKLRPTLADGRPVDGFSIEIPMTWTPPAR
jgi:periplasmic protein TonB